MADVDEVKVHELLVQIDRERCAGFKDCIGVSPEAFGLGGDGIVVFLDPAGVDRETLIEACRVCPADALRVVDEQGETVVP